MKKLIPFFIAVCMLVILIPVAAYASDAETTVDDDYSVIVTLPGSHTTSDIEGISSMRPLDSVNPLKEGEDYDILTDKTLRINYSYLAGKESYKRAYSDWENLYINYDDNKYDEFEVFNYNITAYIFSKDEDRVYTGKATYVTPNLPSSLDRSDYKITYTKSSRSAIGTYSYKVRGVYPYAGSYTETYKVIPKRPTSLKATFYKTKCSLKWSKVTNCSGYKLFFCVEDDGSRGGYDCVKSVKVKGKSTLSKTVTIKRSSYDYVVIKAYKVVNGKYYYSNKTIKRR